MQFDHLSSDRFWDLVYNTAKERKRKKKLWRSLLAPEYADAVRSMAERHAERVSNEISDMLTTGGFIESDSEVVQKQKALEFIHNIRGQAIYSIEKHAAAQKNIRKYAKIADLINYNEYLKDTIEDLRGEVEKAIFTDFDLHTSIESFNDDAAETNIDEWIAARKERRDAAQLRNSQGES